MPAKIKNEFGTITIENEVIARVAGLAAMDCAGIVGMAARGVKDGIVQILKRENLSTGVTLSVAETGLTVGMHIIVKYGTNIAVVCETLVDTVLYTVEKTTGLAVEKINVFVEGVRGEY